MTPLPPDFWVKPQPGGMPGIFIVGSIGAAVGRALSKHALRRGWWTEGSFVFLTPSNFITLIFAAIGCVIGSVVPPLIVFYWAH
jgi:hypothetical protein